MTKTVRQVLDEKGYELFSVTAEETVLVALEHMARLNIGALVVVSGPNLVGVISERHCARELDLKGRSSATTSVGKIMDDAPITVTSDTSIDECLRIMTGSRSRHLPVVDRSLVGLISIGDVGKTMISEQGKQLDDLTRFITGSPR